MRNDDIGFDTAFLTLPPITYTGIIPPFSTRDGDMLPTFLSETPTDFPTPMPSLSTSFDISLPPTLTLTDDPKITDAFPSSTGTSDTLPLTSGDPTSLTPTLTDTSTPSTLSTESLSTVFTSNSFSDSSITIDPSTSFPFSSPTGVSDSFTLTSTSSDDSFSSTTLGSSFTTDFSTFGSSFMTSDPTLTTSSPSQTPSTFSLVSSDSSSTISSTDESSTTSLSQSSSTTSFPASVTTTAFPTFGGGNPTQPRPSSRTGLIVAATTGAIAFVITAALLAILCRRRYLRRVRRRATLDPFLDLDGEMVTVNQPLIIGDGPGPSGAVYSDPYTDDSRLRTQSGGLSLTTGTGLVMMGESNNSSRAVVGTDPSPTPPDLTAGLTAQSYDQHQPTGQLPPTQTARSRSRSPQSLPQVQTQFPPEFPIPQPSIPTFDDGALAYRRYNDQTTTVRNLPGPGNAEDLRLTSAFSAASELSPQYTVRAPPPPLKIDEMLRSSPDPIKTSSSYRRPSFDRRRSFTPSVSGYDHGDTLDPLAQDPAEELPPSPPSEYSTSPHTIRGSNFASRPSPITEVVEMLYHSGDGSNDSGTWISSQSEDTSRSSPVVMTAKKMSLSLTSPAYTTSLGPSAGNRYGESLPPTGATNTFPQLPPPPLPQLPQVQPLSLGKKRATKGPS